MDKIHLVCNAHLDPVWLWEWEEGAAEAISTFRVAADFCEKYDGFVFNHNEVTLYSWVEEYEPALFKRIQKLVKGGRWHIMGGWYLQPDCNMPSGESFVRQILLGREYFKAKFGKVPTTAINFDPFGHTRGLVQILAKSGYDSYLFCRPGQDDCSLPEGGLFKWEGYDGSEVMALRSFAMYPTLRGDARNRVEQLFAQHKGGPGLVLWGVGNHGGGPSRIDLENLNALISERDDVKIAHSTPEAFFGDVAKAGKKLPTHSGDLNRWAVGCYTSQIRIKQMHRQLENELYSTEKMLTAAWSAGLLKYPAEDLKEAMQDLAEAEFHDILPGTSIQPVELTSIRLMNHALEKLSRIKARAFFALSAGQKVAADGEIPILVYNPHPFAVKTIVECEFQLADQNHSESEFTAGVVLQNGKEVPTQFEKELSNLNLDWRKRVVFSAELAPSQMNRFDCRLQVLPQKPQPKLTESKGKIRFKTSELDVVINTRTGLMDRYRVNGLDCLAHKACQMLVIRDDEDPWGMRVSKFRKVMGRFKLMSREEGTAFSGVTSGSLPSVRVIEDGPVRSVIEAVFRYNDSYLVQHYKLPKQGTEIELATRVVWAEKDKMLKLSLPTPDVESVVRGQVAYGADDLLCDGTELVTQKWTAVVSKKKDLALTCIDDGIYGCDFAKGELRITLLRSPGYSAHPIYERPIMPQDRFSPRIDQGERFYRFWLNGGKVAQRTAAIDREALGRNERPMTVSFFPSGQGQAVKPFVTLSDNVVQLSAVKKAQQGNSVILRLFEPTGRARKTTVTLPSAKMKKTVSLGKFEVKTLKVDLNKRTWTETDLMENTIKGS